MSIAQPEAYFSSSYAVARKRFACAASMLPELVSLESYAHPSIGPQGETLSTEVAVLGARKPRRLFINISGVHGVEGYFGSAVQLAALQEVAASPMDLPPNTAVVFVHAMNPEGFADGTRTTRKNNVDMNRNFLHFTPAVAGLNPGYDDLHPFIMPGSWEEAPAAFGALVKKLQENPRGVQSALTAGQYRHSNGLFYGGKGPEWSRRIAELIVAPYQNCVEKLIALDWHTGLGPSGEAEMIMDGDGSTDELELAKTVYPEDNVKFNVNDGDSVSSVLTGETPAIYKEWKLTARVIGMHEVGTHDIPFMLKALWAQNLHRHFKTAPPAEVLGLVGSAEEANRNLVEAFYPASPVWRRRALAGGLRSFRSACNAIARL